MSDPNLRVAVSKLKEAKTKEELDDILEKSREHFFGIITKPSAEAEAYWDDWKLFGVFPLFLSIAGTVDVESDGVSRMCRLEHNIHDNSLSLV